MIATGIHALRFTRLPSHLAAEYLRYEIYGEPDAESSADFSMWVIDTAEGTVLLDAGFTEDAAVRRGQHIQSPVIPSLREAGHDPASVTHVVISHLHYDHTGNLEHFPNARVWVQRREWDFWRGPIAERALFVDLKEDAYLEELDRIAAEGRLELIEGDVEVVPGVTTILLPGHTQGSQGVLIETAGGRVVLASDAAHYDDEWKKDRPFFIVSDLAQMYLSFDRLRALSAAGATIVTGHDVSTADNRPAVRLPGGALWIDLSRD